MSRSEHVLSLVTEALTEANSINMLSTPLKTARDYAEKQFQAKGRDLDSEVPNFNSNYQLVQKMGKKAIGVPRIEMPVIDNTDLKGFQNALKKGHIDLAPPFAKGDLWTPTDLVSNRDKADRWITLGLADGNTKDDQVKALLTKKSVKDLMPSQSQLWLEKVVGGFLWKDRPPKAEDVTGEPVIVSSEGYLLDGHHRYARAMMFDPKTKMDVLVVPIDIKTLIKVGRSYGNAIGNTQNQ